MKKIILTTLIAICYSSIFGQSNAVHFSGANSSIDIGNTIGNGLRTVEMMFRPTVNITPSTTDPAYALVVRNDGEIGEYGMYIKGNHWPAAERGHLGFFIRDNSVLREVYSSITTWNANTWYHVAVTIDATDGMKLYVNGTLAGTNSAQKNPTMSKPEITAFGTWGNANIRYFKGDLDEVRFWNRALTQTEIQTNLCEVLNPANQTGLVGNWHFEEGTGSVTNEEINSTNNALTNVTWVTSTNCLAPAISITSTDADNIICDGTSVTFNATAANASSSPVYQWQINGANVGSNQASFTPVFLNNNDVVTCVLNPGVNQVTSNAIQVTVNTRPTTNLMTAGSTLCVNTPSNSSSIYLMNPGQNETFQWFDNGTLIPGETGSSIPVGIGSNVSALGVYHLSVVVTNAVTTCSSQSPVHILTINPAPTVSIYGPANICTGSSVLLTANSSPDVTSYQWSGPQINGLVSQSVNVMGSGPYSIQVLNSFGCMAMDINHYINLLPAITAVIEPQSSPIFCEGSSVILSAHDQFYSTGNNYLWSNGATTQNITVTTAGNYAVTITTSNGCTSQANINTTVNTLPTISLASTQEICPNTSIILDAGAGTNYSYNWSNNLGNSQTATVNSTGTYYVTVTNANGCSSTASSIVNNSPLCTTIQCNPSITYTYLMTGINCYQVSGATQYQFKYEQLDVNNNIIRTSLTPPATANGAYISSAIPAICYNAHYLVSAHVFKNGVWGPYSAPCNINVGQPRNVSGHGYCGIEYANLNGQMCAGSTTSFAGKFRFKFVEVNGSNSANPGILESTADCAALSNTIPHLLYNKTYKVSYSTWVPYWDAVGDSVKHDWSPYGPECIDVIHDPRNGTNNGYCGIHYSTLTNQQFSTETIALAQKYRLTFTRLDVTEQSAHVGTSPNAGVNIPLSLVYPPLTLNASYSVTISSFVPYDLDANGNYTNYLWSPEGVPCKITTGNVYARYSNTDKTEITDGTLNINSKILIYPNPAKDIINISSESEITKIELFNYNGSLVKTLTSNKEGINLSDVAKGLYFMVITTQEGQYRERIIKE